MTQDTKPYVVAARKFRPQTFKEVLGQDAVVKILSQSLRSKKLAHAYLFSGPRGTGKTTLARIFAKALSCQNLKDGYEPCNACSSCQEITQGSSLDLLEIDGASNRGIDDIRKINETAPFAPMNGLFKIYLIDEVHMLTKEAFNALLKTLEEPPPHVKFFFATTEPHKIPVTILSRCLRLHLQRLSKTLVAEKLGTVAKAQKIDVEEEALLLLAGSSDGCMRDAESLFEEVAAFSEGPITTSIVERLIGKASKDIFFRLDLAMHNLNVKEAFNIIEELMQQGKDLAQFLNNLVDHVRSLLFVSISQTPPNDMSKDAYLQYQKNASFYSAFQMQYLLEYLLKSMEDLKNSLHKPIAVETILLHYIQSRYRVPPHELVARLVQLESALTGAPENPSTPSIESSQAKSFSIKPLTDSPPPASPAFSTPKVAISKKADPAPSLAFSSSEPAPLQSDTPLPVELGARLTPEAKREAQKTQTQYDTLLQFAAVELEGSLKKASGK